MATDSPPQMVAELALMVGVPSTVTLDIATLELKQPVPVIVYDVDEAGLTTEDVAATPLIEYVAGPPG